MFAIVILCLVATLVTGKPLRSADFDHYVFTQVYPAGMCFSYFGEGKGYECNFPKNASTWTIHGLWPTEGSTKGPNYCDQDAAFDPSAIASLLPQLVAKWTNCLNETKFYSFWSHEYLKHGTCTGLKEFDFFNKVLEIYQDLPHIGNAFNNADVVPNNQKMYDVSQLQSVLNTSFGVSPVLQCISLKGGEKVLEQIQLCLDLSFKPMECPDTSGSCSGDILYPQYTPN